ncbi:MAG: type II toxin-antitoxin system prevent-host-death family antitoxin [Burkholderiales bacterium]|nr:type II toxin-antitoxin system prevent-host-death family antitoxin [Burkholderiales bacterium]
MNVLTYCKARANLANVMKRVCEDHEPIIITRNGDPSVVVLSLEDFKSLEETAYLLRTPANSRRLLSSVAQLKTGKRLKCVN